MIASMFCNKIKKEEQKRIPGLQDTIIRGMANSGCYFLCLCQIAELEGTDVDVVKTAISCIKAGWLEEDFFVRDAGKILNKMLASTGKKATVVYGDKPRSDTYNIREWFNKKTGLTHFTLKEWDPMKTSLTKKNGKVRSYRIVDVKPL